MTAIEDKNQFIHAFRQSSPYINTHRKKTFVIHLNGHTLLHPSLPRIIQDIALLKSLGVKIVLVYGTKPQNNTALTQQGINFESYQGKRITSHAALDVIKHVYIVFIIQFYDLIFVSLYIYIYIYIYIFV